MAENSREVKNIQLPGEFTEELLDSLVVEIAIDGRLKKFMKNLNGKLENTSWEN